MFQEIILKDAMGNPAEPSFDPPRYRIFTQTATENRIFAEVFLLARITDFKPAVFHLTVFLSVENLN